MKEFPSLHDILEIVVIPLLSPPQLYTGLMWDFTMQVDYYFPFFCAFISF